MLAREQPSDADLVAMAAGGDRAAFSALVERHYGYVFRLAWRLTGDRGDAEDVAQEVCVSMARAIGGYRGSGALTTWLYAMTLNASRDLARRSRREDLKARALATQVLVDGEAEAQPDDPAAELWEAVRGLPDKQREAITLVYGEGLSHRQAAEAMDCAEATVSWHVHEARKRLKSMMTAGKA